MSGNKRWYADNAVHSDKWANGPPSNKKRAFSPIRHDRSGPDRRRSPRRNSPERRHFDSGGYDAGYGRSQTNRDRRIEDRMRVQRREERHNEGRKLRSPIRNDERRLERNERYFDQDIDDFGAMPDMNAPPDYIQDRHLNEPFPAPQLGVVSDRFYRSAERHMDDPYPPINEYHDIDGGGGGGRMSPGRSSGPRGRPRGRSMERAERFNSPPRQERPHPWQQSAQEYLVSTSINPALLDTNDAGPIMHDSFTANERGRPFLENFISQPEQLPENIRNQPRLGPPQDILHRPFEHRPGEVLSAKERFLLENRDVLYKPGEPEARNTLSLRIEGPEDTPVWSDRPKFAVTLNSRGRSINEPFHSDDVEPEIPFNQQGNRFPEIISHTMGSAKPVETMSAKERFMNENTLSRPEQFGPNNPPRFGFNEDRSRGMGGPPKSDEKLGARERFMHENNMRPTEQFRPENQPRFGFSQDKPHAMGGPKVDEMRGRNERIMNENIQKPEQFQSEQQSRYGIPEEKSHNVDNPTPVENTSGLSMPGDVSKQMEEEGAEDMSDEEEDHLDDLDDSPDINRKKYWYFMRRPKMGEPYDKFIASLYRTPHLADVKIICKYGHTLTAHKFLLASLSPKLNEKFKQEPMLKEIHMKDSVMDKVRRFLQVIYNGEYLVSHLQLSKCLLIAAALDIQGLTHEECPPYEKCPPEVQKIIHAHTWGPRRKNLQPVRQVPAVTGGGECPPYQKSKKSKLGQYKCPKCNADFTKENRCLMHEMQKHGTRYPQCLLCCILCINQTEFEIHMQTQHHLDQVAVKHPMKDLSSTGPNKPMWCPICSQPFPKRLLPAHKWVVHNIEFFPCAVCLTPFETSNLLNAHMFVHARLLKL